MAQVEPEQTEKKSVGLYKNWQIQRIEKLHVKLKRPFNRAIFEAKSRTQLKTILKKLNKEVLLI